MKLTSLFRFAGAILVTPFLSIGELFRDRVGPLAQLVEDRMCVLVCVCVHSCFQGHYPSFSNLPYKLFCTEAGGTAAVHLAVLTKLWCSVGRDTGRSILYLQFFNLHSLMLLSQFNAVSYVDFAIKG